jgi:molybdopterin/thiamine biosynthesis adenylyltransferase
MDSSATAVAPSAAYLDRFGGVGRLFGRDALPRLRAARVAVVGVGGVGSWTAEGLARSGIGHLTLIDLDDVCVTNANRQLPALEGQIGRPEGHRARRADSPHQPRVHRRRGPAILHRNHCAHPVGWPVSISWSMPSIACRTRPC